MRTLGSTIFISLLLFSCHQNDGQQEQTEVGEGQMEQVAPEIDLVDASPDQARILLENDQVRVIEYTLKPGEKDTPHTHPQKVSYIVSGGRVRVYPENGAPFDAEEIGGRAEWRDAVGKHYVENIGTTTVTIILTEVKSSHAKKTD